LEHFGRGMILQGSAFFLISYLLAFFSYRYFEKPIINSRNYFHASMELKVVLFAGMGLMAMISAIMLIPTMKFMG
jgi:peptidoglycan/LPS O-acetylase OafA/YrhL